jgi:hypothetical protein
MNVSNYSKPFFFSLPIYKIPVKEARWKAVCHETCVLMLKIEGYVPRLAEGSTNRGIAKFIGSGLVYLAKVQLLSPIEITATKRKYKILLCKNIEEN